MKMKKKRNKIKKIEKLLKERMKDIE